jgi:pimeloyl-ACP methyl ester carboxylesterase
MSSAYPVEHGAVGWQKQRWRFLRSAVARIVAGAGLVLVGCHGNCAGEVSPQIEGGVDTRSGTVASADGVHIHYATTGTGDVAVVLVHCWTCDSFFWDNAVPVLSRVYQVVTLDLAGHGASGSDRSDYTMPAFGQDVAAVVRALDLHRVILVGHSMGGGVVMEAARLLGNRVVGLVGIDTMQRLDPPPTDERIEQFVAPGRVDFPSFVRRFMGSMFAAGADSTLVARYTTRMSMVAPEVGISALENTLREDLRPLAQSLSAPVRLIVSPRRPVDAGGWRAAVADFDFVVMEGVGHFPMLTAPDRFDAELLNTVNELAGREARER